MITFETNNSKRLLDEIKRLIDQKHITTWSYDAEGDFTHCVPQWERRAWLRPRMTSTGLVLNIIPPITGVITWELYGVYQGRFLESITVHAHDLFMNANATASPSTADIVKGSKAS